MCFPLICTYSLLKDSASNDNTQDIVAMNFLLKGWIHSLLTEGVTGEASGLLKENEKAKYGNVIYTVEGLIHSESVIGVPYSCLCLSSI